MSSDFAKQLIDAGVHFGHHASKWNPKMKPYIFGKRNAIHIINIKETLRGILLAKKFLTNIVADGKDVLLVGTKRQARNSIEQQAKRVSMHYVNDRWLGGTLTNFREIRKRIGRLDELERLEADGLLDTYSKKEGSTLRREICKIRRNLGGIRNMTRMPGAIFIVDQKREIIAIREAKKMGIPVVCLLDTDCDPDLTDLAIPGNDDAMRAIEIIATELCDAVAEGMGVRSAKQVEVEQDAPAQRRRSRRPTTARAEGAEEKEGQPAEQADQPPQA